MKKISIWFGVSALVVASALADTTTPMAATHYDSDLSYNSVFHRGGWELGVNSGIMFSPFFGIVNKRVVDYTTTGIQGGYMLSDPMGSSWLRGNFELVVEFFGGGAIHGEGNYIAGMVGWMRYNFLPENGRFKPYVQLGGGAELTDFDTHLLGQRQNFNVDAGVGFRYMLTRRCALNVEYRFQHLSDAGQTEVNVGINAHGPVVGVSWFF